MNLKRILCTAAALTFLAVLSPSPVRNPDLNLEKVAREVKDKDVVYFGEVHDSAEIHNMQLTLLKELYKENKNFSVGMEMVQKDYQHVIDDYLNNPEISEEELKNKLNWKHTWGFDFEFFEPIFKFAKENKLNVIALNAPKRISYKVANQGLESLTEEDFKYVPKDVYLDDKERESLYEMLKKYHPNKSELEDDIFYRRLYEAQSLWNETMAQAIVDYLLNNEGKHLLVIAGDGHISLNPGIPGRAERRAEAKNLEIETSIISPTKGDYIIYVKKK